MTLRFEPRPLAPEFAILNRSQHHVTPVLTLGQPTRVATIRPYLHPSIAWTPEQAPAPRELPASDRTTPRKCALTSCEVLFVPSYYGPVRRYCSPDCRSEARNAAARVNPPIPARRLAGRDGGGSQTP